MSKTITFTEAELDALLLAVKIASDYAKSKVEYFDKKLAGPNSPVTHFHRTETRNLWEAKARAFHDVNIRAYRAQHLIEK